MPSMLDDNQIKYFQTDGTVHGVILMDIFMVAFKNYIIYRST